jgi:hypothetical protein
MLNPSTADAINNDPTIERCQRRAMMNGYGGIIIANIFAYRSTDPRELKKVKNPVGLHNDLMILRAFSDCETVICGWGKHGSLWGRGEEVLRILTERLGNNRIRALKINKDGSPAHPLYIGYDVKPIPIDIKS